MWNIIRGNTLPMESSKIGLNPNNRVQLRTLHGFLGPKISVSPEKQFHDFINRTNPSKLLSDPFENSMIVEASKPKIDSCKDLNKNSNIKINPTHQNSLSCMLPPIMTPTSPRVTRSEKNVKNMQNRQKKHKNKKKSAKKPKPVQMQKSEESPAPAPIIQIVKETMGNPIDMDVEISDSEPEFLCYGRHRQRQVSTTESEDSFICFVDDDCEDKTDAVLQEGPIDDTTKDCEMGNGYFNSSCSSGSSDDSYNSQSCSDLNFSQTIIPQKKVRFADENELCEIHSMVMWSFAYQSARKGPWEECARDRERFKRRVANTEAVLKGVLSEKHRAAIYQQRFVSST